MWVLIAEHLCPIVGGRRHLWIEGFLAALEAVRGVDGEPGIAGVLQDSIEREQNREAGRSTY